MFTGIVEELGQVKALSLRGNSGTLTVKAKKVLEGTKIGDSIAVNGVCLTVTNMKNNELFKSIPIVMLSSEESTTERIRLLEEGAEDYILKPFNPLELKIRIKKIID